MKRWWAGALLFWILVIAVTVRQTGGQAHAHNLPFDSTAWKMSSRDDGILWPTRLRMADDLVASGILKGKTRAEVREMLGEDGGSADDHARGKMAYPLGPGRGLGSFDIESLSLDFGEEGRVTAWRIKED